MTIYAKLNAARLAFHAAKLKKSGRNTFANYDYFELGDFLRPGMEAMHNAGLCALVSFTAAEATMRIVDIETGESITITSPMSEANLKGCHPVQNVGAVETYQRRYLWMAALEIVEHDAVDASPQAEAKAKAAEEMPTMNEAKIQSLLDGISAHKDADAIKDAGRAALLIAKAAGDKSAYKQITDHTLFALDALKVVA